MARHVRASAFSLDDTRPDEMVVDDRGTGSRYQGSARKPATISPGSIVTVRWDHRRARQRRHQLAHREPVAIVNAPEGRQLTNALEVHNESLEDRRVALLLSNACCAPSEQPTKATRRPWWSRHVIILDEMHVRGEGSDDVWPVASPKTW